MHTLVDWRMVRVRSDAAVQKREAAPSGKDDTPKKADDDTPKRAPRDYSAVGKEAKKAGNWIKSYVDRHPEDNYHIKAMITTRAFMPKAQRQHALHIPDTCKGLYNLPNSWVDACYYFHDEAWRHWLDHFRHSKGGIVRKGWFFITGLHKSMEVPEPVHVPALMRLFEMRIEKMKETRADVLLEHVQDETDGATVDFSKIGAFAINCNGKGEGVSIEHVTSNTIVVSLFVFKHNNCVPQLL